VTPEAGAGRAGGHRTGRTGAAPARQMSDPLRYNAPVGVGQTDATPGELPTMAEEIPGAGETRRTSIATVSSGCGQPLDSTDGAGVASAASQG
jgi:hypothetical protein